jgi:hypothetical protein
MKHNKLKPNKNNNELKLSLGSKLENNLNLNNESSGNNLNLKDTKFYTLNNND